MNKSGLKRIWYGSLFLGGCLLSFYLGKQNRTPSIASGIPRLEVSEKRVGFVDTKEGSVLPVSSPELSNSQRRDLSKAGSQVELDKRVWQISDLAKTDPRRAFFAAEAADTLRERTALKLAAFEGWGSVDLEAAIEAIWRESPGQQEAFLKSALQGAGARGNELLAWYRSSIFAENFPPHLRAGAERGVWESLLANGNFAQAIEFAEASHSSLADNWLSQSYSRWAAWEPESAVAASLDLTDARQRQAAYRAALLGWSESDPSSLTAFASELPKGPERSKVFQLALSRWVSSDPLAASAWLEDREPAEELDVGALALVNHPYLAERQPEVAVSWAESLSDPGLRGDAIAKVLKQWAATDRMAALSYLKQTPWLSAGERHELLSLFGERSVSGIDPEG